MQSKSSFDWSFTLNPIDMFYQKRIYLYFAPRSRMCDNPYKCGDGLDCIGEPSEIKTVNGGWSEWSEWSENDGSLSRYVLCYEMYV